MGISRDKWHKRRPTGGKQSPIRCKRKFEIGRQPANTKLGERRVHPVRCYGGFIKFRALKLDHGNYSWPGEAVTRKCRIIDVVYNSCNSEFVRTRTLVKGTIVQIDASPFVNWYQKHYGVVLSGWKFEKPKKKLERGHRNDPDRKAVIKARWEERNSAVLKKPSKKDKKGKDVSKLTEEEKKVEARKEKKQEKKAAKAALKVKGQKKASAVAKVEVAKPVTAVEEKKKDLPKLVRPTKTGDKKVDRKAKLAYRKKLNARRAIHKPSGALKKKWRLRNASRVLESAIASQFEKGRLLARIASRPGQGGAADGYVLEGAELAFYVKKIGASKKGKKQL